MCKQHYIAALFCLFSLPIWGQQQATLSQYMFNGLAINPAYAGSQEALSISALTRFQNIGMPGAPTTQTLAIHSPLVNRKVALGLLVVHDKISVISQTGLQGIYAYRIRLSNAATLSMGLQAGVSFYAANYTKLETYQTDPVFSQDVRQARPNFGVGFYYTTKLGYLGLSMPHMMNNIFDRGVNYETIRQSVPIIFTGGYVFTLNRIMKVKPNFLLKVVDSRIAELDINANFLFDDILWVGASYKTSESLTWLLELQATDQFRFGYAYTFSTGLMRQAELGSHELLLSYRFKSLRRGIITPRYF